MYTMNDFCGQKNGYSRSITLRNKLIPIGKTEENLAKLNMLENDKKRANTYQEVKNLIDDFHRAFIQDVLSNTEFEWGPLYYQFDLYQREKDKVKKNKIKPELQKRQEVMRKKLVKKFKDDERFNKLFAKELLSELLPEIIKSSPADTIHDKEEALKVFDRFSTYFTGFHENRKNMYSAEEQSTAISYRVVNENFPKFYANIKTFEYLEKNFPQIIADTETSLKEQLNGKKLKDIFNEEAFNSVLSQTGIDFYNTIIGGVAGEAGTEKTQGLNEKINLARQQLPDAEKNKLRGKMVVLYKQILSDRETASFFPVGFEDDAEVYQSVKDFKKDVLDNVVKNIKETFNNSTEYNLDQIFVPAKELTAFSQSIFGHWSILSDGLFAIEEEKSKKVLTETQSEKITKEIEKKDFSLTELQKAYEKYCEKNPVKEDAEEKQKLLSVTNYFDLKEQRKIEGQVEKNGIDVLSNFEKLFSKIDFENQKSLQQEKEAATPIKEFLDEVQNLYHFLKLVDYRGEEQTDTEFYSKLQEVLLALGDIIPLYNKVRNFVTKKPGEVNKIKVNFDCSSFLSGWGTEYGTKEAFIFLDNGRYYLGVINQKLDSETIKYLQTPGKHMLKQVFVDFQKPDYKNFPRLFIRSKKDRFAPAVEKFNLPINDILEIYDNGLFQTEYKKINPEVYKDSLIKMIDYFKLGISQHESYKSYNFCWKESSEYESISDFYADVTASCYKLRFVDVNYDNLLSLAENVGENNKTVFLFEIYNKDFSIGKNGGNGSTGRKNLHTLYFENLFSKENLANIVLKLSGQAEIFIKEGKVCNDSDFEDKDITHKKGTILVNRTTKDCHSIPEDIYQEIYKYLNKKTDVISLDARKLLDSGNVEFKTAKFDLIKNKHHLVRSFYLHCSIIQNFKAPERINNFNQRVCSYLSKNPDVKIIGLDRGERHLIYLSLINQKGEIELQKTLNLVEQVRNDKTVSINYQEKLVQKEGDRDKARKNWQTIGNIKELKEGYLSNVVHEIAKLMIENNAIVVMEDLNFGFKRGRFAVERQVYQKFEKMLIDKLNYLVFKNKSVTEPGGVLNAYQLTDKFTSFKDLGKQCGWLFYIPAAYTSKIDPKTGFANLFNTAGLTNVDKKKDFFDKFDGIRYDSKENCFVFSVDYSKFGDNADFNKKWELYTRGERIVYSRKENKTFTISPTENLKVLFKNYGVTWNNEENFIESLKSVQPEKTNAKFFDDLLRSFNSTLQMRNSEPNSEIDYLISPVKAEDGTFFDSRIEIAKGKDDNGRWISTLPVDADANGAYHIALKGLYLLQNDFNRNDKGYIENIKNADWFEFVQEKAYMK